MKNVLEAWKIKIPEWRWKLFWIDNQNKDFIKNIKKETNLELKYRPIKFNLPYSLKKSINLYKRVKSEKLKIAKKYDDFFPYKILSNQDHEEDEIYVDSYTEKNFLKNLFVLLDSLKQKNFKINCATKHFLPSEIYYEYKFLSQQEEWYCVRKSYPDVFLKVIKNNIPYTFVIEIKNIDPKYHDSVKVQSLKNAYRKCSKKLKQEKYIFAVCLWANQKQNKEHEFYVYQNGTENVKKH